MPFIAPSPMIDEQQAYTWHGITRRDLLDIWNLLQTINRHDNSDHSQSISDLENQLTDPWSNPLTDGRVVRTVQGKLAAFARVFVNPEPTTENLAILVCECDPAEREQGLEEECLVWLEERATERLAETAQAEEASALPRVMRTDVQESDSEKIALYQAHGFEHVRSFFKMERDLNEPIPDGPLPAGLTFRTYAEDIDGPLRHAFNEAFSDHWGFQPFTAAEWHPSLMDMSDLRRDLTLVVMDGDEVAAFSFNRVKIKENERLGIQRGWIGHLGTRRKYRKQGIASSLIAESMRRFRAEGFDKIGPGVDAENLTSALALYDRLGFYPIKTGYVLENRLD